MKNSLNKFLITLSGITVAALGVFGLKYQKDFQDMQNLQDNLQASLAAADKVKNMIDLQQQLETARRENLSKVDTAQIGAKTETQTQTVVIPGKTITQTTTKKSSSTSSSSKTTKTS